MSRASAWPRALRRFGPDHDGADVSSAPTVLVLGAEAAMACAVAFELARAADRGCALLCVWEPSGRVRPGWTAGASRPARREALRLQARGLPARADGRLARVALGDGAAEAATTAERVIGAAGVPVVVALLGPRPGAFDPLLEDTGLVVVATPPDSAVGALAGIELAHLRAPVARCSWTPGPLARPLVLAGRLGLGAAAAELRAALAGLSQSGRPRADAA